MSTGTVAHTIENSVARVHFYHPKGNSLPSELLSALAETFDTLAGDTGVRAIVLESGGESGRGPFCSGASLAELVRVKNPTAGKEFFSGFARVILAMRNCPQFVIARVHGKAVGGGVGLVAAADYAVAHSSASVKLSELAIGIGPFVVGPVVERKLGTSHFSELAISADWRSASWAAAHGLYCNVVESIEELDKSVQTLADACASRSPAAVAALKETVWSGTDAWQQLLYERAERTGTLVCTAEAQCAIRDLQSRLSS